MPFVRYPRAALGSCSTEWGPIPLVWSSWYSPWGWARRSSFRPSPSGSNRPQPLGRNDQGPVDQLRPQRSQQRAVPVEQLVSVRLPSARRRRTPTRRGATAGPARLAPLGEVVAEPVSSLLAGDEPEASGRTPLASADGGSHYGVRPRNATSASVADAPEGASTSGPNRPGRISGEMVARLASIAAVATSSGRVAG